MLLSVSLKLSSSPSPRSFSDQSLASGSHIIFLPHSYRIQLDSLFMLLRISRLGERYRHETLCFPLGKASVHWRGRKQDLSAERRGTRGLEDADLRLVVRLSYLGISCEGGVEAWW